MMSIWLCEFNYIFLKGSRKFIIVKIGKKLRINPATCLLWKLKDTWLLEDKPSSTIHFKVFKSLRYDDMTSDPDLDKFEYL
jgi:hypothetical protein